MAVITLDVESAGLDPVMERLYLIAYRINGGQVKVVDHSKGEDDPELRKELDNPENILRGHHIVFDALFLHYNGYPVRAKLDCTRILAYLNFPFEESGLKSLVVSKLRRSVVRMEDFAVKPKKKELPFYADTNKWLFIDGKYYDKEKLVEYNKADVINCDDLRNYMDESQWYRDCEQPLISALYRTQVHGMPLDVPHLNALKAEFDIRLAEVKAKLGDLNPNSPKQVVALFSKKYDLSKIAENTASGSYKCDKMFLKNLAWNGDEDAKTLLEYRKLAKLQGTYVEPLLEASAIDGKVHGKFNQAGKEGFGDDKEGTATGRLTSSDPNLQNIPTRTREGKRIRQAFVASPGYRLFDADLKQIEPRLVAHYSQASKLLNAYANKLDTHGMFASDIFGKPVECLTPTERFIGKTSWLATFYGCSFKKLLYICELNSDEPLTIDYKPYINEWDHCKPQYKGKLLAEYKGFDPIQVRYAKWCFFRAVQDNFTRTNQDLFAFRAYHIDKVKHDGGLRTLAGRWVKIEGLDSPYMKIRMSAERLAVNYQIQPSAAEMMKMSIVRYDNEIVKTGKGMLLATIHDELLGQIREDLDPDEAMAHIKSIMCDTAKLKNVPVDTDAHWMTNWSEK